MAGVKADGLSKIYRTSRNTEVHALKGVDLQIEDGEFIALLGPSGSGKTTALRCIAGLERPSAGKIVCGDRVFCDMSSREWLNTEERRLSMVFQSYALWPHMDVQSNVIFGLRRRGVGTTEARRVSSEVLSLVGLGGYEKRSVSELSGGQMQRVALARALAAKPEVVLMDEPLSNLDPAIRLELRDEIQRLHRQDGTTTIYVTHDQSEALALADRIAVFREGRIEQLANKDEMRRRPATLFVADFLGFKNQLQAVIENGQVLLLQPDGRATESVAQADQLQGLSEAGIVTSQPFVLAFHPEAVELVALEGKHDQPAVEATIDVFHPLSGRGVEGTVVANGLSVLFAGQPPRGTSLEVGDRVRFRVDPQLAVPFELTSSSIGAEGDAAEGAA